MKRVLAGLSVILLVGTAVGEEDLAPRVVDGKVLFSCKAPSAKEVYLAGSFNGWNPQKDLMQKGEDGIWRLEVSLSSGHHEYKFVIDGVWTTDPNSIETAPDPYGGQNSVINLTGEGENLRIMKPTKLEPGKSIIPYLSGRYVSTLLTRRAAETGEKFRLTTPEHDVRLDFTIDIGGNVEAWAETKVNTVEDDPSLKLKRAHARVDAKFGNILAFYNQLALEFDEPLGLVGKIGEFEEPFGEEARGVALTSKRFTPYKVKLLAFYADDSKEVDRSGIRIEAGERWRLGVTFVRFKPVQAIPVLGFGIPLSKEWDPENFAFLPGSWWRQFYTQYYDSTGSDTRSNDVYYYFHFSDFTPRVYADKTYGIDGELPIGKKVSVYGEYAFRTRPSFQGVSDMHTIQPAPELLVDSTQMIFDEKYNSHTVLGGIRFRLADILSADAAYQVELGDVTTNLGRSIDDPAHYEPKISTAKAKLDVEPGSFAVFKDLKLGLKAMVELCKLIDGFQYGDHLAFYDYFRLDRYGYIDNFYNLYFKNPKRTMALQPMAQFELFNRIPTTLSFKWKRYTCQRLSPSGEQVAWRDYYIDTGEFIGEASLPLTSKLKALVNYRLQSYSSSQDDYLFFRYYFANTYNELAYSISPNVKLTASYGVDPWDRRDRYMRKKGREDFLAAKISEYTSIPNYGRDNDYKIGLIREAERALERETRFSLVVEVNF